MESSKETNPVSILRILLQYTDNMLNNISLVELYNDMRFDLHID